ncbi:hypothetical protein CANCADRAFT_17519, partial [Tortispora caseinolytica NRRL Y-17796]
LGVAFVRPKYKGPASTVGDLTILVNQNYRNQGIGKALGKTILSYARMANMYYVYMDPVLSVNAAASKLAASLKFARCNLIRDGAVLPSKETCDIWSYGIETPENLAVDSNSRFAHIKMYIQHGIYPPGTDRVEKSRIRASAAKYRISPEGNLLLGNKQVIESDAERLNIVRALHSADHSGVNKLTGFVAELYHWPQIKATARSVVRSCPVCR